MTKRTFVLGDVHGEFTKLKGVLDLVEFDYENDVLISLGDVVDRGIQSYDVVEHLLTIKNLIAIQGNHDYHWLNYLKGLPNVLWTQGGAETLYSYEINNVDPFIHFEFFRSQRLYYIDENNNLFVHGGFDRHLSLEKTKKDVFLWDRDLFRSALSYEAMNDKTYPFKMVGDFKNVFIGHTPTIYWSEKEVMRNGILVYKGKPITQPMRAANIWNLDTGAVYPDGKLTIMNVNTQEYWQI